MSRLVLKAKYIVVKLRKSLKISFFYFPKHKTQLKDNFGDFKDEGYCVQPIKIDLFKKRITKGNQKIELENGIGKQNRNLETELEKGIEKQNWRA